MSEFPNVSELLYFPFSLVRRLHKCILVRISNFQIGSHTFGAVVSAQGVSRESVGGMALERQRRRVAQRFPIAVHGLREATDRA